ncbi:hypothetical protein N7481_005793 [Penicillium waksmanii]|uniref:uncharacterized protein n=1 Tax=Penicillium waksmanii TaxID=69791 RepID=UPI002547ACCF|nr:uncharacterized protein N7481_005793 [Penicillium waksmanii]KAJ5983694.1 hypothetical protein N7481_005793 [Penicillium waksmanii]
MEIPSHELRSFRVGLVLLPPAIARCDHPIYPLSPLLPASADLNMKLSNLDPEIQLLREESSISLSDRDFVLRLLQHPELLQGFSSTETVHRLASALSSQQNEEASDSLDAQSSQRDSLTRFQLPVIGPRDYGPRETAAPIQDPPSALIEHRFQDHSSLDSSSLLLDLLERLEGETPLTIDPGTAHGRTTPPSPSIYDNDLGETETFFRDSSSSSTQDSRVLLPDVKLPGRTLSQSYRQVVDDFPADEGTNDGDTSAQH